MRLTPLPCGPDIRHRNRTTSSYLDTKNNHFPPHGNTEMACADGPSTLTAGRSRPKWIPPTLPFIAGIPSAGGSREIRGPRPEDPGTDCREILARPYSQTQIDGRNLPARHGPMGLPGAQIPFNRNRKLHLSLIPLGLNSTVCGGTAWLKQYVLGFPLVGNLPRASTFRHRRSRSPNRPMRRKS